MAIDFSKLLSPEQQAALKHRKELRADLKTCSEADLADMMEYVIVNCFALSKYTIPGISSYEQSLMQAYLPEVLRRLRKEDDVPEEFNNERELQKRVLALGSKTKRVA